MSNLEGALRAWRERLAEDRVLSAEQVPDEFARSTLAERRRIAAVVQPLDTAEVQQVVRAAAEHRVPLYPISTGNNWGYGERNPPIDDCVVVDLSRMNSVLHFDADLGLITIQPGLTHGGMHAWLESHGHDFMVPVHGGGPTTSPLGNALERGYGITPHTDHFSAVTDMEVVLPSGDLYRSAITSNGGQRVDRAYKWGTGPYIDGLFTQSAMGIVTEMTIALAPRPQRIEAFVFGLPKEERLEEGIVKVRSLINDLGGVLGAVNFMNDRRLLSMLEPYPHDEVPEGGIIPASTIDRLKKTNMAAPWTCAGALYGTPGMVRAAKWTIRKRMFGTATKLIFFNRGLLRLGSKFVPMIPGNFGKLARTTVDAMGNSLDVLSGKPNEIALPLAYWRSGGPPADGRALHPSRDQCGLLWYSPLVPIDPAVAREYVTMVKRVCTEHGMEPLITMTTLNNRCYDSTIPIVFDASNAQQVERAHACYDALFDAGRELGCLPYRASIRSMRRFVHPEHPYWQLVTQLKASVDPHGIIAPGRYLPHEAYEQLSDAAE